tara:strand:+ start:20 stop:388 length:369 start_codon:yes stop_codon:yes gene_type:complete
MLINFCWFLVGAMTYKGLSYIFGLHKVFTLYAQTMIMCLKLVQSIDETYGLIMELKYETQKDINPDSEANHSQKELDQNFRNLWRKTLITTIITFCPKELRGILKINDWDTAMKLLKESKRP